jgi:sigma-B regulation protein RsbU (phosphoserine phosphatase)
MSFELSTMDAVRFALAVLVTASGLMSLLLFFVRIRKRDTALLYFGWGTTMYGMRFFLWIGHRAGGTGDLALTLLLPIPLMLLMVEIAVPQWRKLAWWIVGIDLTVAIVAMSLRLLGPWPLLPWRINNFVVLTSIPVWVAMAFLDRRRPSRDMQILRAGLLVFLLFVLYTNLFNLRLVPGRGDLEYVGFTIFLGSLGVVAVSRTQRNEERLLMLHKELEIARDIQAKLLPEPASTLGEVTVASRYVPATSVAGDFYDFLVKDGGLGLLIADVSGHGIPAALSASMVKVAVRAQADRADNPAEVLREMNSILCGNLQGQFVSAGYLFLNPQRGALSYAGAGHPPLLVWRAGAKRVESIEENGILLGIFPGSSYSSRTVPLEHGDRCLLYTDGLLEAPSVSGEEFGPERLSEFLGENAALPSQNFCDALVERLTNWRGSGREPHDDLTVVVADFQYSAASKTTLVEKSQKQRQVQG